MYTEQTITCVDCNTQFPFTTSEQEFFAEKGFTTPPRRCKPCRMAAKANREGGRGSFGGGGYGGGRSGGFGAQREMHDATCSACGVTTQVPFRPNGSKPVYCRDCFRK
ncbi:zinc-ribbon domain containing protein [bacterium]|nr:zinc-ribbon domain containing protein [bacterium]